MNELDDYLSEGWEEVSTSKHKAKIQKLKPIDIRFEDDIWCMFYNLGFRILNYDEKLVIQWGKSSEERHQIDVVAVGEEAIFVVECKATENIKQSFFQERDRRNLPLQRWGNACFKRNLWSREKGEVHLRHKKLYIS